jgi:hypothetical protein
MSKSLSLDVLVQTWRAQGSYKPFGAWLDEQESFKEFLKEFQPQQTTPHHISRMPVLNVGNSTTEAKSSGMPFKPKIQFSVLPTHLVQDFLSKDSYTTIQDYLGQECDLTPEEVQSWMLSDGTASHERAVEKISKKVLTTKIQVVD